MYYLSLNRFFDDAVSRRGGAVSYIDDAGNLRVEVPGVKRGQIRLSTEAGDLRLEVDGEHTGFRRTWRLSDAVDRDAIRARLEDGVLTVELPLRSSEARRQIDVG